MDTTMASEVDYEPDPNPNETEDTDAFDAFNDDTFGADADTWNEDEALELAKLTEEEMHGMHGIQTSNDFFELEDSNAGDDDCLEPAGSSTINGDEDLADQMASLRTSEFSSIPPPPIPMTDFPSRPPAPMEQQVRPQFPPQPEFVDPAMMSMGQMPLPPRPPFFPPHPNVATAPRPMTVEEIEREMMAKQQQEQQQHQLLMQQQMVQRAQMQQHLQQQQQHQQHQQQQQQQMLMQQQMMQRAQLHQKQEQEHLMRQQQQFQQFQQQHQQQQKFHHNQQRQHNQQHLHGYQSRQQQQHYQQFQQHQQPQQRYQNDGQQRYQNDGQQRYQNDGQQRYQNDGQQRYQNDDQNRGYNSGRRNFNRGRESRDQMQKAYDDKDRETFGDDFVTDHQQQQRFENKLIMPGHVHVQSILRGTNTTSTNTNRGHQQPLMASTGNPTLDMQREQQESRRPHHHHYSEEDEYAGLMISRERQWIINIQLQQLKDENDYYYTVHRQKKKALEEGIDLKKGRQFFFGEEEEDEDSEDDENNENRPLTNRILRRDDETQLLLKSESASLDSPRDKYRPQQYENSLGKLQAVTVKAPRKIIDVMGVLNQDAEQLSAAQKDSRNFKKTLLELERLYNILIDVEDCEKKLVVLPTGTSLRSQVEADGKEGIQKFGQQLVREDKLKLYIAVRKGKALLIRALRWLNTSQMRILCTTLFMNYPLAVKKDRDDKLLKEFWSSGMRRHLANCSSLGLLHYYLTLILSDQGQSKSGSILKHTVTTPLGMSFLLNIIHKLSLIHQQQPNADKSTSRNLLMTLAKRLQDECKNEKLSPPVTPMGLDMPNKILDTTDLQSENINQLQRLAQAGLHEHEMSPDFT